MFFFSLIVSMCSYPDYSRGIYECRDISVQQPN